MADDDTSTTTNGSTTTTGNGGEANTSTDTTSTTSTGTADDQVLEGLGEAGRRAIQAERARARELDAKVKELEPLAAKARELEDANKTEIERVTGDRDTYKGRAETAERELTKLQIGLEAGLTPSLAARLSGSTEEELKADAQGLAKQLAPSGRPAPAAMQGQGGATGGAQSADDWLREQARKS